MDLLWDQDIFICWHVFMFVGCSISLMLPPKLPVNCHLCIVMSLLSIACFCFSRFPENAFIEDCLLNFSPANGDSCLILLSWAIIQNPGRLIIVAEEQPALIAFLVSHHVSHHCFRQYPFGFPTGFDDKTVVDPIVRCWQRWWMFLWSGMPIWKSNLKNDLQYLKQLSCLSDIG